MTKALSLLLPLTLLSSAWAQTTPDQLREQVRTIDAKLADLDSLSGARYPLLMEKGELLIQIGQPVAAGDAFKLAIDATTDAQETLTATANAAIVKAASTGLTYKGREIDQPIDIVAPDSRKSAMRTLANDRIRELRPQLESAQRATSLPEIDKILLPLSEAYALDTTGESKEPAAREMLQRLSSRARELMRDELARLNNDIERINAQSSNAVIVNGVLSRENLNTTQLRELEDLLAYTQRIRRSAVNGEQFDSGLDIGGEKWDAVVANAEKIIERANGLLIRRNPQQSPAPRR